MSVGAQDVFSFLLHNGSSEYDSILVDTAWELEMCFHCCWHSGSSEHVSILVGTLRARNVGTRGAWNMFPFLLVQWELGMCFRSCCTAISLNIDDNVFGGSGNIRFRNLSLSGSKLYILS